MDAEVSKKQHSSDSVCLPGGMTTVKTPPDTEALDLVANISIMLINTVDQAAIVRQSQQSNNYTTHLVTRWQSQQTNDSCSGLQL